MVRFAVGQQDDSLDRVRGACGAMQAPVSRTRACPHATPLSPHLQLLVRRVGAWIALRAVRSVGPPPANAAAPLAVAKARAVYNSGIRNARIPLVCDCSLYN